MGSPRFVIKHTKNSSHLMDPSMECLQGTSLNAYMHKKRPSEQKQKPQNHVVLQATIASPTNKLFQKEISLM